MGNSIVFSKSWFSSFFFCLFHVMMNIFEVLQSTVALSLLIPSDPSWLVGTYSVWLPNPFGIALVILDDEIFKRTEKYIKFTNVFKMFKRMPRNFLMKPIIHQRLSRKWLLKFPRFINEIGYISSNSKREE